MIRQAHSYLVGAVSGTALIAAAIVVFVLLISTQAFRDWPLPGLPELGSGGDETGAVTDRGAGAKAAAAKVPPGTAGSAKGAGGTAGPRGGDGRRVDDIAAGQVGNAPVAGAPTGSPGAGNQTPGSNSTPGSSPAASSGSKSPGSNGGGGGQASGGDSTSGQVANTVNDTVSTVDQATGGALGDTGVTKATEGVVNGVAGPESAVGKTVDKVVDTVGGLVGGGK